MAGVEAEEHTRETKQRSRNLVASGFGAEEVFRVAHVWRGGAPPGVRVQEAAALDCLTTAAVGLFSCCTSSLRETLILNAHRDQGIDHCNYGLRYIGGQERVPVIFEGYSECQASI